MRYAALADLQARFGTPELAQRTDPDALAITVVFLLLVALYESWAIPLTVMLIQASWVWLINHPAMRWVKAKGRTLISATQNRNEHSRIVLSANSSEAMTPRAAPGRKTSI